MLTRKWWVILLQGLLLIILSIIILNNPGAVLLTISLWLGIIVLLIGIAGLASYFFDNTSSKEHSSLFWSFVITIIGLFMITKIVFTQLAISVMFGLIVTAVGFILIMNSINIRKDWSKWWILAISGAIILLMGISSIFSVSSGAENISILIGIPVLMSGIGLIVLAFLKKSLLNLAKEVF